MDLAFLPSPSTGVVNLGPIPLRAYAFCIILGIFVALWLSSRRWAARGGYKETVGDIAMWAVPFGLVGGRLYHVITSPEAYFGAGGDPIRALYIWEGGLGIWGAIALGGVGAWIGCRRQGVSFLAFADTVAPGVALAQAIGRWGNWFNQELYGKPTTLPWGLEIDPDKRPHRDHRPGDVPPHLPLRITVERGRGGTAHLGEPQVGPRTRQDLRPLCGGVQRRALLDRVPADR